jgi:hypothetical protein
MGALSAAGAKATVQGTFGANFISGGNSAEQPRMRKDSGIQKRGQFGRDTNIFPLQTSLSTCPPLQTFWLWPRSRLTSPQSQRARTYDSPPFLQEISTERHRSSSNGVESLSLSVTAPPTRSRKPSPSRSRRYAIPNRMRTVSRSQSGWSWSVSAPTWDVCPSVRLVISEDGSVLATVLTTISLDV